MKVYSHAPAANTAAVVTLNAQDIRISKIMWTATGLVAAAVATMASGGSTIDSWTVNANGHFERDYGEYGLEESEAGEIVAPVVVTIPALGAASTVTLTVVVG